MRVILVGLNHKTAPVEVRERFAFPPASVEVGLRRLHERKSVEECVILSTCNRVEVYAVTENEEECIEGIKGFLSEFHRVPLDFFLSYIYILKGRIVVRHLLRVASSLDSMVLGEPQILGQVKEAYATASERGTTGIVLNRLFHRAFSVAKRVRTETEVGNRSVSVSHAAVELAKRIFENLSRRSVMLIGVGDMGERAARHLVGSGIRELLIANRTFDRAQEVAAKLRGKPIKIEEIYYKLKDVDIVITATGSTDFIIKPHHVREALKLRRNEPMFMIDIAVPRDIDPRIEEIANVYLYDIDDLRGVLDENIKVRKEEAKRAEGIVAQGEKSFEEWLDGLRVVPAIISLRRRFEEIRESEVEKALRKLGRFSEKDRKIIESMASGIIGKLLYGPMSKLKKEASTSTGALYVDALRRLFELDKDFDSKEEDEADAKDWE